MADINSFQDAGSFNTQTQAGPGFSTPGAPGSDLDAFFNLAAKRKADAAAEERRRYDQEFAMKEKAMKAQQQQQANMQAQQNQDRQRQQYLGNGQPQRNWVAVPAMKRLAYGVNSATTEVPVDSPAAGSSDFGVRGY